MPPFRPADLTVVVSAVGETSHVGVTLASLRDQTASGFATIVLVHSEADLQGPLGDGVDVLRVDTGSLTEAYDLAATATSTRLVLVLTAGLEATPGLIAAHVDAHNRDAAETVGARGAVQWHPSIPDTALRRWLDQERDRDDWGVALAANVSFKTARYLSLEASGESEPSDDEASLVLRLRRVGVHLQAVPAARALDTRRFSRTDVEHHVRALARSEARLASSDPTFDPPMRRRVLELSNRPPVPRVWTRLAGRMPGPLGRVADRRADAWHRQQVVDVFLDAWEGQRDLAELRGYLGSSYDYTRLVHHVTELEAEEEASPDEAEFYRRSETYLYDLTVFAMSGTKAPYRRVIRSLVSPGARLLDYGCGIGSDGLRLLDEGYAVEFADFDNPSTRMLRWRLAHRGIDAPIHDVDADVPGDFDLAYSFDVIEHIEDPVAFLENLESKAAIVVVNFLAPTPGDIHLHKPLDVPALVHRATKLGLLWYRTYHGRSHLVAYRTGGGPEVPRALSEARRWIGTRRAPRAGEPATHRPSTPRSRPSASA